MWGRARYARGKGKSVWFSQYDKGVPQSIDPFAFSSIPNILRSPIDTYAQSIAFQCQGKTLTYEQTDSNADAIASFLVGTAKLKKGARVAIMAPNILAFPIATLGILRAGLCQVNVNPLYTARELEHQLKDSGAEAMIIFEGTLSTLREAIKGSKVKTVVVTAADTFSEPGSKIAMPRRIRTISLPDAIAAGRSKSAKLPTLKGDDFAFIQYTGGTTGVSKGATLTHRNIVANMLQVDAFMGKVLEPGNETIITALPLYHIFALTVNFLIFFRIGGKNILVPNARDIEGLVSLLSAHRPTAITGVNTLFNGMMSVPGINDVDFSQLRLSIGGGAAIQQSVSDRWKELTGRNILEGYGLSETSPVVTMNPPTRPNFRPGIGIPVPSTEVSLRDDNNKEVKQGEPGEICVRGPQVMQGYWNRKKATREVMTRDGYFKTGDIAIMEHDGQFVISDRKKDMILVSGFNVYPNEIEAVVAEIPGVVECACIGIPDEKTGEAVKVFVVRSDDSLSSDDVIAYCREKLAAYKVPKQVVFIAELPKSPVGKILRRELRDL